MNKKGDEKLLFVFTFIVWIIVAFAIIAGVYIFYNVDSDIRMNQAEILFNRLFFCVSDGGHFNYDFLKDDFNVFQECGLNSYYFNSNKLFVGEVVIINISSNEEIKHVFIGPSTSLDWCNLPSSDDKFVLCTPKREFNLKGIDNDFVVKVRAGSNNKGGKV